MLFDGKQTEFQSEIHKIVWAVGRRIVPFDISTAEITDSQLLEGLKQVYDFTVELFSDMYANPDKYELTTKNIGFFHEQLFKLLKQKKVQEANEWAAEKTGKYPLFLKYFAMCVEASQKRPQNSLAYVMYCDFRIFNKRVNLKIDDLARGLPDREAAIILDVHNYLLQKGAKPYPRLSYVNIQYGYKKNYFATMIIGNSTPLGIYVSLGKEHDDEQYKFIVDEIGKLANKEELLAFLVRNIKRCTYCCTSARDKSCGKGKWADFFGERRLLCGFELKIPNKGKIIDERDIELLKIILDLRIKAIDLLS